MSTPPQAPRGDDPLPRSDDRTRDIRLPSLPDRPPSAVRPEWQAHVRPGLADPAPSPVERFEPGSGDAPDATAVVSAPRAPEPAPPRPYRLPDEPTDKMSSPPQVRQPTLAFDSPAAPAPSVVGTPAPVSAPPQFAPFGSPSAAAPGRGTPSSGPPPSSGPTPRVIARERKRRWPWVVLTVLPILVIIAVGILLFVLLGGA